MSRQVTEPAPPSASSHGARHGRDEPGQPLPRDRRLERLRQHAHRHERVAQVRRAQERLAPRARAAAAPRAPRRRARGTARAARVEARDAGLLEAEHQQVRGRPRTSAPPRARRPAGSWRARSPACTISRTASQPAAKDGNATEAERRVGRPRAHAHPRPRDDARACPRSRAASGRATARRPSRAAAATPRPRRRRVTRPHRLDEVVDVRRAGREVPGRARGDPAAERRELERLREEAQRQPVRGELLLEPRARSRRPRSARRARRRRPRARGPAATGRRDTAPSWPGRAPGRRRRPRSCRRRRASPPAARPRTTRARAAARPRSAGRATASGGCGNAPAERAHDVAVGGAVRVHARARGRPATTSSRSAGGDLHARRLEPQRRGRLELGRAEAEVRGEAGRRLAQLGRRGCSSS